MNGVGRITMAALCALATACGGGATDDGEAGDGAEQTSAGGEETPAVWADMSHEQRFQYMRNTVMPTMRDLFQATDPERYADFGCTTCHGENAQDVQFSMPNGLVPLSHEQIPQVFQSQDPMPQLMTQQVWPRMAELLGEAPFDPETGEGFSCMRCHATAEAGAEASAADGG